LTILSNSVTATADRFFDITKSSKLSKLI